MLTSIYCYCVHKLSTKILHLFLRLCDMCSKSIILQMLSELHKSIAPQHLIKSQVNGIIIMKISYYNLKYIHNIFTILILISIPNIKGYYCIKKIPTPKIQYCTSLLRSNYSNYTTNLAWLKSSTTDPQ